MSYTGPLDLQAEIGKAIQDGIRKGIIDRLTSSYGANPITGVIESILKQQEVALRDLFESSFTSAMQDQQFRDEIQSAIRSVLAKTLVSRFGGELEKRVNDLKSDPTTRARITLAIEEIVKSTA